MNSPTGPQGELVLPGEQLVALLRRCADAQPDTCLYTFLAPEGGADEHLTHRELDLRARRIACLLQARGVPDGTPVLLLFHPGIDYICAFFGCLYAGAIPVPAYPPTHARQLGRLQAIVDDAAGRFALTCGAEFGQIAAMGERGTPLSVEQWLLIEDAPETADGWRAPVLDGSDIAFLQYTSGSTGSPKGVMVSHANVLWNLRLIAGFVAAGADDVMVFWLPPYHDFGLIGGVLGPLVTGCRAVLMRPASFLLNPLRWLKAITAFRATLTGAPNFAYDLCVRAMAGQDLSGLDLSSLRVAFNGAEPIRQETLTRFAQAFEPYGFRRESWLAAYGLAESTLMVSGRWGFAAGATPEALPFEQAALAENRAVLAAPDSDVASRMLVNTGSLLPRHEVAIVSPATGARCGVDEIGEIWVHGPCVAQGYWRREEATRDAFHARPADDATSPACMRTGDLGFVRDGQLYICGREKDLIIVQGQNVYPQDIELAAFASHPALRRDGAVAFSVDVDEGEHLVIVQELDFGRPVDAGAVQAIVPAVMAATGLVPDVVVLVKAGRIPRTSSGKVRRRQCRDDLLGGDLPVAHRWNRPRGTAPRSAAEADSGAPSVASALSAASPEPAQSTKSAADIEAWICAQIAERVGIDAALIDPEQPFAMVGLSSVVAVQLAAALGEWLRLPLTPVMFWDYPSPAQLAHHLAAERAISREGDTGPAPAAVARDAGPIAVIGIGCRFPGASGPEAFWQMIDAGHDGIREIPAARLAARTFDLKPDHLAPTRWGGFLDEVDRFDAPFFGISPLEAQRMDPQQRLLLETAWHAFEDAGIAPASVAGTQTGVFVGISTHDYDGFQAQDGDGLNVYAATGSAASIAANRLSYFLDANGPSLAIDTACSSSLVAVHHACASLRQGESVLALAGGVNLILSSDSGRPFAQGGMLSPNGSCRAFDADANGYVRGEGCGVVVLKRLADALRDGDPVRAVIAGSAMMQDGRSNGLVAPNGQAQARLIRRAFDAAGVAPTQVGYVEAHGTGTVLGDPIELNALKGVFGGVRCRVGSVKSQIGHLEAAAGIAGLIKAVLALQHGVVPAQRHYGSPNPHCPLDGTGLSIPTERQLWASGPGERRHAGVSSFGFGGTLCHVVLAEAPLAAAEAASDPGAGAVPQLLLLSAQSEPALAVVSARLGDALREQPSLALADVAHGLRHSRQAMGWRRALVCADRQQAVAALAQPMRDGRQVRGAAAPVAFLFPGQGAQSLRMGHALYRSHAAFRAHVDASAQRLREVAGLDVLSAVYPVEPGGNLAALTATAVAQPALFVIEHALARTLMDAGVQPAAMLGHSLGEYVAATLAGVFSLDDALELVAARGALMQAQPAGAMLGVATSEAMLRPWLGESVSLAAVNAPERCVVGGPDAAIAALEQRLGQAGVSCRRLPVSHAFHSTMMASAAPAFGERLARIALHAPALPFVSNVTGGWITAAEATDPAYWVRHMLEPVRFADGLATVLASGARTLLELGPGQTLCALARMQAVGGETDLAQCWPALGRDAGDVRSDEAWLRLLGGLWTSGQRLDASLFGAAGGRHTVLPVYPFQGERHWVSLPAASPVSAASAAPAALAADAGLLFPLAETPIMTSGTQALAGCKDEIEGALRALVASYLRSRPEHVDPHAPLLELGADSLVLVQVIRSIEQTYGVTLSVRQLFEELTTISAIAGYLAERAAPPVSAAPVVAAQAGGQPAVAVAVVASDAPPAAGASSVPAVLPPSAGAVAASPSALERVISEQLSIFERMTQLQLAALSGAGASLAPSPAAPATAAPAAAMAVDTATPTVAPAVPAAAPSANRPFVPYQPAAVTVKGDLNGNLTPHQRDFLDRFIDAYIARTRGSKERASKYRPVLADNRASAGFRFSVKELLYPIVSERSEGATVWDVDGNAYIDLTMGFGVNLFGHRPDFIERALEQQLRTGFELGPQAVLAGEVAELVHRLTGMERVAFTNSGTEAVTLSLRLARTVTQRKKIAIFAGSFHGWGDDTLAEADPRGGSVALAPGLQPGAAAHTLVLDYGTDAALEAIRRHAGELAAVLVEPIQSRRPDFHPREFLHALRALTREHGIALIFDEMISGFRLHPGGAQAWYDVRADIVTYGKVVGGGMPAGIVAGAAHFLDAVDGGQWRYGDRSFPQETTTFFAGTFCKHPLMLAAARAVLLKLIDSGPALQTRLNARTAELAARLNRIFTDARAPVHVVHAGSLFRFVASQNVDLLFYQLLFRGLYIWEGRNMFLSTAHTDADLERVVEVVHQSVQALCEGGFLGDATPPDGTGGGDGNGGRGGERIARASTGTAVAAAAVTTAFKSTAAADTRSGTAKAAPATPMRFSLSFFGHYDAGYDAGKYDLLMNAARYADTHGFHALWVPERHFHAFGGLSPNPAVLAAALARETASIRLRAGSVVLPLHHPMRVAEEWSVVDNLSNGRVGIACASGWHPNDFVFAPEAFGSHRELMFERLRQVKSLWRGEPLRARDGSGKDIDVSLYPMPRQAELPVWITIVNNADTYRRAGEVGAGVLTNLMGQSVDELRENLRIYREALQQNGHDANAGNVTVLLHTFVCDDLAAAREAARLPFIRYLETSIGLFQNMARSLGMNIDVQSLSPADRAYLLDVAYDRYVKSSALIGTPDSCEPIVARLREIGVDEIGCFVDFGVDSGAVMAAMPHLDALRERCTAAGAAPNGAIESYPLSEAQQGIWFECQLDRETALGYHATTVIRLGGRPDVAALRGALATLVARHAALRTVFDADGARQHTLDSASVELGHVTLVDPVDGAEAAAERWLRDNNHRSIDPVAGPVMRCDLLTLSAIEHRLVLTFHHLVMDGLSQEVLLQELAECYGACLEGRAGTLPAAVPFSAYVAEHRAYVRSAQFARDEAYWLGRFAGELPPALLPPGNGPMPARGSSRAAVHTVNLDGERYAQLVAVGRRLGATMAMTVGACLAVLLHRLTGQPDLVIGMPMIADRPEIGDAHLVGYALNLVPVRFEWRGQPDFARYLADVKQQLIEAYMHSRYPFGQLLRKLGLRYASRRRALAPVMFNLNRSLAAPTLKGLDSELLSGPVDFSAHELMIDAIQFPERLELRFQYGVDLFVEQDMTQLAERFLRLLEAVAADPTVRIGELPMLADDERRRMLRDWNETAMEYEPLLGVHGAFEAQVARTPDAEAVRFGDQA
ncbi:MupA/Atu3671 family FMN-dependent luciferase-like monooxygenase, partial [Burkholderia stagnalis]